MGHYAKILEGKVLKVIVAEQDFIDTMVDSSPGTWLQASYNTSAGVHKQGGTPLRKNFPSAGFSYDSEKDAFIPPQPYPSWTLNEETCIWDCPVAYPDDDENDYSWNETDQQWDLVNP
jgi:hypothetical protein